MTEIFNKHLKVSYFKSKNAILTQIHKYFRIYAHLLQSFVVAIYALFRQYFWAEK